MGGCGVRHRMRPAETVRTMVENRPGWWGFIFGLPRRGWCGREEPVRQSSALSKCLHAKCQMPKCIFAWRAWQARSNKIQRDQTRSGERKRDAKSSGEISELKIEIARDQPLEEQNKAEEHKTKSQTRHTALACSSVQRNSFVTDAIAYIS